jgi:hypothetical protein
LFGVSVESDRNLPFSVSGNCNRNSPFRVSREHRNSPFRVSGEWDWISLFRVSSMAML